MTSNIANRNVSLIMAIGSFAGLLFCVYSVIAGEAKWTELCSIATSTAVFLKLYLTYRREVKNGNLHGRINPFRPRSRR